MSAENKVFDITKFKAYRRTFYDALGTYSRTMLYLQSAYRGFGDMEWKGTIADEVKTIVGTDEIEMSQNISRMLLVFSNELDEIMTSFETDLDSGENARYDVENMTAVDEQVKEYQTASLAIFNSVQDIYDTLTAGFSKYGSYNAPDATAAITSFEELCGNGGTGEDAGFIQNCITKFKTFDEDMTDYLNEMKLKDQIAEIMSILEGKAGSLDADMNASVTANDDYFSKLGWDDYNPIGIDISNEASRNRMSSAYIKYYDNNVKILSSISSTNNGKFDSDILYIKNIYEKNKEVYQSISRKTGVPAELICAIHYRESGCDFDTYLHNGQKLGKTTTIAPVGIYFDNFEDAAVDALSKKITDTGITFCDNSDMATYMTFAETFNGLGYSKNGHISPYLYSGTSAYSSGKYVKDGEYNASKVDSQVGVYCIVSELLED